MHKFDIIGLINESTPKSLITPKSPEGELSDTAGFQRFPLQGQGVKNAENQQYRLFGVDSLI